MLIEADHRGTFINGRDPGNLLALTVTCRQIRLESADYVTGVTRIILRPELMTTASGNEKIRPSPSKQPISLGGVFNRLRNYRMMDPKNIVLHAGSMRIEDFAVLCDRTDYHTNILAGFTLPSNHGVWEEGYARVFNFPKICTHPLEISDVRFTIILRIRQEQGPPIDLTLRDGDEIHAPKQLRAYLGTIKSLQLPDWVGLTPDEVASRRRGLWIHLHKAQRFFDFYILRQK